MEFRFQVAMEADEDPGEAAQWITALSQELEELDDTAVVLVSRAAPDGAKGFAPGELLTRIPLSAVKTLISFVRAWAVRTSRTVEVSIDGDSIKITGASEEQQDRLIEAWLVRHTTGS